VRESILERSRRIRCACKILTRSGYLLPGKPGELGILREFFLAWKDQRILKDFLFPKL